MSACTVTMEAIPCWGMLAFVKNWNVPNCAANGGEQKKKKHTMFQFQFSMTHHLVNGQMHISIQIQCWCAMNKSMQWYRCGGRPIPDSGQREQNTQFYWHHILEFRNFLRRFFFALLKIVVFLSLGAIDCVAMAIVCVALLCNLLLDSVDWTWAWVWVCGIMCIHCYYFATARNMP